MTIIVFEQTHLNWQQKHCSVMYNICTCSASVPGCPGCAEGSVSLWEQWKGPYHCNGSQVANELSNYVSISGRFKVNLHWRIFFSIFRRPYFLTRFLPALLTPRAVSTLDLLLHFFDVHLLKSIVLCHKSSDNMHETSLLSLTFSSQWKLILGWLS